MHTDDNILDKVYIILRKRELFSEELITVFNNSQSLISLSKTDAVINKGSVRNIKDLR